MVSLADIAKRMSTALEDYGSRVVEVNGIGPVFAARLARPDRSSLAVCELGSVRKLCRRGPVVVASRDRARHRLSRSGDRQLNAALHLIAVAQVRMRRTPDVATIGLARK
jgi:transposase